VSDRCESASMATVLAAANACSSNIQATHVRVSFPCGICGLQGSAEFAVRKISSAPCGPRTSMRYLRERGHEVLYICATDEHGTPAELAAQEAGLPVEGFCRQQYEAQKAVHERFLLQFDHFGRSSSAANRELTQHFARRLWRTALSPSASSGRCTRSPTAASCRTGMSWVPARTAGTSRRAETSARTAPACWIPPS
jgi:hypothetical protein